MLFLFDDFDFDFFFFLDEKMLAVLTAAMPGPAAPPCHALPIVQTGFPHLGEVRSGALVLRERWV